MLRENAVPVEPMSGSSRSFQRPSGWRAFSTSDGGSSSPCLRIGVPVSNRLRSRRSSLSESRLSAFSPTVGISYHCRLRLSLENTECSARLGRDLLTGLSFLLYKVNLLMSRSVPTWKRINQLFPG